MREEYRGKERTKHTKEKGGKEYKMRPDERKTGNEMRKQKTGKGKVKETKPEDREKMKEMR